MRREPATMQSHEHSITPLTQSSDDVAIHQGTAGEIAKCGVQTLARRLHDGATIALDHRPENPIVAGEGLPHLLRLPLPKPGAALDVGEKKGQDPSAFARIHRNASMLV